MNPGRFFVSSLAVVVIMSAAPMNQAHAQAAIDASTRGALIQKLTQVYLNLAPNDSSKVALTLRLADLHAERARQDSMNELAAGCVVCNAGQEDRLKALAYYSEVLVKVPESSIGKVLSQVGHLYEMTGNQKDAIATYQRIIKEQKSPEVLAEANLSLAEVYFKKHQFAEARQFYSAVLQIPQAASRGLAAYRLAWCEFNEGQLEPAIDGLVRILKSPELLSRNAAAGAVQVDKQFQEEVSRDLATFLARRTVTVQDGQLVYELSPEQTKVTNIVYLASEVERLGQVPSAIALWRFAQEKQARPEARLESHVRLAQLQMEQKHLTEALTDFDAALRLWVSLGSCNENDCRELKARLRKFVTDWNRIEKKAPTEELLKSYLAYLKVFSTEGDMQIWAAKVASDLKQYDLAVDLYLKGVKSSQASSDPKEAAERIEAGLLGAIETAELAKEPKLLDAAYSEYLQSSRERKKALEVQYQKAHLVYERGEYAPAAEALRAVALSKETGSAEIKKQAADLSLDALVLIKDDKKLEAWAEEYAKAFPAQAREFTQVARKAILTQSVQTAAVGIGGAEEAWKTLSRYDLTTASPEEKISFYKNKLILAEKLQKFQEARDAADALLRLPGLTSVDQTYALSRKAWLAELILDFDGALAATEKLPATDLPAGQKWLKLAMYADLASRDAKSYYGLFLKESKDEDKNVAIAVQLVRDSKEPAKEIEKQKAVLEKRPEMFALVYLEVFAKTGAMDLVKKALSNPSVAKAPSGKILARVLALGEYAKIKEKISTHQLDGSNQKKMALTLKARISMIEELEKIANRAIESGDWTSQLVTLDLLAKQSDRFYQEILGLPVPAGLSAEDEQQYLMLLSQQAAPHQIRAQDLTKKVSEFWANESAISQLDASMSREVGPLRTLVANEVKALVDVAPEDKKTALVALLEKSPTTPVLPTLATLEGARQAVRENPMSRELLEKLLSLEKQMGRQAMVAYLEGRLQTLDAGSQEEKK